MRNFLLSLVASSTIITSVNADFLGAEAGYAVWNSKATGSIQNGNSDINLKNDLGYGDTEANSFYWASFDHFIPLVPNIKVQKTNFTTKSARKNSFHKEKSELPPKPTT